MFKILHSFHFIKSGFPSFAGTELSSFFAEERAVFRHLAGESLLLNEASFDVGNQTVGELFGQEPLLEKPFNLA